MNLFTTYFFSNNSDRQSELDKCLDLNIANESIKKIFIFIDPFTNYESVASKVENNKKISLIKIKNIPMYSDWVNYSSCLDIDEITMFANADIYFDDTIEKIKDYLRGQKKIICLTRHEENMKVQLQPEWSQDFWAMKVSECNKINFIKDLEIQTGRPGCDNKLACCFTMAGWDLYNPFNEINCIHAHKSNIRTYDRLDPLSAGFLANVHESKSPDIPSDVSINVVPLKSKNIREIGLNIWLEEKINERDRIRN